MQEVETGALVPGGRLYTEENQRRTPTSWQVHPNQNGSPRDTPVRRVRHRKNDGTIQWIGTRKPILIIQAKSTLLNQ